MPNEIFPIENIHSLEAYLRNHGIDTGKPFRCLNPEHEDKRPSMSYDSRRDRAHCFSCGVTYDLADAVSLLEGLDKGAALRRIKNSFYRENLDVNGQNISDYWRSRGFTQATIERFGLRVNGSCAFIPFDENYCISRSIKTKNFFNPKGQPVRLYDPENANGLVFVVEGAIDAISILQVLAENELPGGAVALNGVAGVAKMAMAARADSFYCLALDNDDAGKGAQKKLAMLLSKRGIRFFERDLYGRYKDANECLIVDSRLLCDALCEVCEEGERAFSVEKAAQKDCIADFKEFSILKAYDAQYGQDVQEEQQGDIKNAGFKRDLIPFVGFGVEPQESYSKNSNLSLLDDLFGQATNEPIMTGLLALDEATGGLVRAGLTVLGAPCGTGKTTLCLNIADNLAKAGMDVLFFSLEMPRRELILKSLSRETLRLGAKEAVPVNELAHNADSPAVKSALEAYSRYAGRVFMAGMTPTQDALEACVRRHIEATGNIPFVVVDYLQLLSPDGARAHLSDKQALDRVVYALKSLCRETGVTMLVVSSLNRQGYHDICMEAFKESGSIEYSSDLLLGLKCDGSRAEVKVLKHRYGEAGKSAALRFYAKYGCFV